MGHITQLTVRPLERYREKIFKFVCSLSIGGGGGGGGNWESVNNNCEDNFLGKDCRGIEPPCFPIVIEV